METVRGFNLKLMNPISSFPNGGNLQSLLRTRQGQVWDRCIATLSLSLVLCFYWPFIFLRLDAISAYRP